MTAPRALLVDDNPDILYLLHRQLRRAGWACCDAETVDDALTILSVSTPFDLIVVDLMMPTRDGTELIREVRGRGITTPIAVMSGKPLDLAERDVAGMGADRVFAKSMDGDGFMVYANGLKQALEARPDRP